MNRTWLILDCNYLCHRAKHSTGKLSFKEDGTGIIYGVLKEIAHLMEYFGTKYIIFCWDTRTNLRTKVDPFYKGNRHQEELDEEEQEFEDIFYKQMRKLETEYLRTIGFRNIFKQEGYESDDIMASISLNLPKGDEAVIVTGDHDMFQLLNKKICVYTPRDRKIITHTTFERTHGIKAKDWAMVKAIAGCNSDNVKGVARVGEKTAIKYLLGTLKKETKAYQNIIAAKKDGVIKRNLKLVRLPFKNTDVFRLKKDRLTVKGWRKVTKQLGMKSLTDVHIQGMV